MRTYRMTNFDGLSDRTGKRKKQMTKQARAPRLQAPKIINRSHLFTVVASPWAAESAYLCCDGCEAAVRKDSLVPLIVRHGASSSALVGPGCRLQGEWRLSGVCGILLSDDQRLTCKPSFLLFSPRGCREWSAGALRRGKAYVATVAKWIQRLDRR